MKKEKNKKLNTSERGITLIALIVTIIILIILVAISIKAVAGENLIDMAEGVATNYKSAEEKELNMLQNTSDILNNITTKDDGGYLYLLGNGTQIDVVSLFPQSYAEFTTNNFIMTLTTHATREVYVPNGYITYSHTPGSVFYDTTSGIVQSQGGSSFMSVSNNFYLFTDSIRDTSDAPFGSININSTSGKGQCYYLGRGREFDIKSIFPNNYEDFTNDNFLVQTQGCSFSYYSDTDGQYCWSGIYCATPSYDSTTGVLTINERWGCSMGC